MAQVEKYLINSGVLYTDRRQFYLDQSITKELWPSVTPFLTAVSNRSMRSGLADPIFKQFEHRSAFIKQEFSLNDASPPTIPNDDTGIACTVEATSPAPIGLPNSSGAPTSAWIGLVFDIWDVTKTTRRGTVMCTAVSGADCTMKNLRAGTIATADNDVFVVVGNAHGEGASSPEPWSDELRVVWGSTQNFRTSVQVTGTLLQASLRGYSKELARLRMEKNKEHQMHIEKMLLRGDSVQGTGLDPDGAESFNDNVRTDANGNRVRTTLGLITAIERYGTSTTTADDQNIFEVVEGSYKYGNFVNDMEKIFQYYPNNGQKTGYCGAKVMSYFSKMDSTLGFAGQSGWQVRISDSKQDRLGFNYRILETPHGILKLVHTPALRNEMAGYMVITQDENLSVVQYRPTTYKTNIKTDNAPDLVKDEWHDDLGIAMSLIETHSLWILK